MQSKVSIIVPIYNVEECLEKCIESILRQSYTDIEVILVNDGSTDNSGDICTKYAKADSRVKYVKQENGGVSGARNKGLDVATGRYIAFVDSDDVINVDFIKTLYELLIKEKADISACAHCTISDYNEVDINDTKTDNVNIYELNNELMSNKELAVKHTNQLICLWNKLYKKELFDGIRFPEGKVFEDMYVYYKILDKSKKTIYMDRVLYYYYMRDNSISHENFSVKRLYMVEACQEQIEYFKVRNNQKRVEVAIDMYIYWLRWCIDEMKKSNVDCYNEIKSYRIRFRKYVKYLRISDTCPIKKILKYYYFAYFKRI